MDGHTVFVDFLLSLPLSALTALIIGSTDNAQGLLLSFSTAGQVIWSQIYILPLSLRRKYPQLAALLFVGLCMIHMVFGPSIMLSDALAPVMLYSVIVYGDPRNTRAFISLAFVMAFLASVITTSSYTIGPLFSTDDTPAWLGYESCSSSNPNLVTWPCVREISGNAAALLMLFVACLLSVVIMAFWQRARLYTVRMMQERNASLQARQREEARIAALAERRRIARDMHDVVAHTLSTIIVQSDAGRYAGSHDVAIARSTMQTIDHESDAALRNMRQLLGIFEEAREQGHTPTYESSIDNATSDALPAQRDQNISGAAQRAPDPGSAPESAAISQPRFEDIRELITEHDAIAKNPRIIHRIEGTPEPHELSGKASTAAYRIVQESLSNINKYAGHQVHVTLTEQWSSAGLQIRVEDDGLGAKSSEDGHQAGFGLVGMTERVRALGGSVQAGPVREGGFMVEARLPFNSATDGASTQVAFDDEHAAKNRLPLFLQRLRSKPFDQAEPVAGKRFNHIERMSQWSERHYTLIDMIIMLIIIALGISSRALWSPIVTLSDLLPITASSEPLGAAVVILALVPTLCFRRRFPQSSAGIVMVACILQLLCIPDIYIVNLLVLLYLHAVILLGPSSRIRWTMIGTFGMCILLGVKLFVGVFWGYPTLLLAMFKSPLVNSDSTDTLSTSLTVAFVIALGTMALCTATIASALWTRAKGNSALVLREREEALRQEEEQQRLLAASMERDRIGNAIQHEVTSTLRAVKMKATDGLATLDLITDDQQEQTAQRVQDSFAAIGKEGRAALAHMRRLLRILRETRGVGTSPSGSPTQDMELQPAPTLEEQIQHLTSMTSDSSTN
jgi:signal transduction histidine kinase